MLALRPDQSGLEDEMWADAIVALLLHGDIPVPILVPDYLPELRDLVRERFCQLPY
jgi:hypothetical protein